MKTIPVQQVVAAIHRKFRIDMDYYEVLENCIEVVKKMGMLNLTRKQETFTVSNYCVKMEQSVHRVLSAVQLAPYVLPNDIVSQDIHFPTLDTIKNDVISVNMGDVTQVPSASSEIKLNIPGTPKGTWVDFEWNCPYVRFNYTDFTVFLEFTELEVDEEGIPLIPEEALDACVYYNVYSYSQPGFLTGKIPQYVMKEVEQWKNQHVNQAKNKKAFNELSRNEHSKILDVITSMDRKRTNIDN